MYNLGTQISTKIFNNITYQLDQRENFSIATRISMSLIFFILTIIGIIGNLLIIIISYSVPGMVNFNIIIFIYIN